MWFQAFTLMGMLVAMTGDLPPEQAMREAAQHAQAGEQKMQAQAWNEAIAELNQAVALNPTMAIAYFNLGHCQMALKRFPEAEAAYRASVGAITAQASLSEEARARQWSMIQDEIREIESRLRSLKLGRSGTESDPRVARMEERIRFLENSRPTEGKTATVPAELSLALGGACLRQGKLAEAEQAFTDAVAANPKMGSAHNNLAVVYMFSNRFEDARKEVKLAEKSGFKVSPAFKKDLKEREKAAKEAAKKEE